MAYTIKKIFGISSRNLLPIFIEFHSKKHEDKLTFNCILLVDELSEIMNKGSPIYYNSPVIQRNTPLKRLGLSRKRKSSGSGSSLIKKKAECSNMVCSPISSQNTQNEIDINEKIEDKEGEKSDISDEGVDFETEIESLEKRIEKKKLELEALKVKGNHIVHLENLTDLWKNGCKNAYLHLIELLKEKEVDNLNYKTVLNNLGVLKTMKETFENDSEVSFSDSSQ